MTIRELRELVGTGESLGRLPYPSTLIRSNRVPVMSKRIGGDAMVAVYDDGIALYRSGNRATVIRLGNLQGDYTYENLGAEQDNRIPETEIDDLDWDVVLTLIGEDRIWKSMQSCDANQNVFSYSSISEDYCDMEDKKVDVLGQILLEEDMEELHFLLSLATERQRMALMAYYESGENASRAARCLGISRQALDELVAAGLRRINTRYFKLFQRELRADKW